MARVTVEDCLQKVDSRFSLVHLATKRVRQLREGAPPLLESKNKEVVLALREIAAGKVYPVTAEEAAQARAEAEARERQRLSAAAKALPAEGDQDGEAAPADDPPAQD